MEAEAIYDADGHVSLSESSKRSVLFSGLIAAVSLTPGMQSVDTIFQERDLPKTEINQDLPESFNALSRQIRVFLENERKPLAVFKGDIVSVKYDSKWQPLSVEGRIYVDGEERFIELFPQELQFTPQKNQRIQVSIYQSRNGKRLEVALLENEEFSVSELEFLFKF